MASSSQTHGSSSGSLILLESLRRMEPWLKCSAWFSFLLAAILAFSVVGILIAWIPLLLGILLYKSGSNARQIAAKQQWALLPQMIRRLYLYFVFSTVTQIILLAIVFWTVIFLWPSHGPQMAEKIVLF